jgi:HlyD family secretion protein
MYQNWLRRFPRRVWGLVAALLAVAAGLAVGRPVVATLGGHGHLLESIPRFRVRRADVAGELLAAGRVASVQSTEIRCTLERLDLPGQGGALSSGASTILSLLPDGSTVGAGDVLCEMDASDYKELARRQEIVVEQARADHMQASLALEVAKIAVAAYREGEQSQVETDYKGRIALAQADLAREGDRVEWVSRMLEKGYASRAQLQSEKQTEERLRFGLQQSKLALENYTRFTAPKELLALRSQVIGAESTLGFQTVRLKREEDRLAHYRSLIDRCIVRAPHGGYLVHANRPGREPRVYEGAPVRERMPLFTLPDQSRLEVEVMLHETTVERVRTGMPATIHLEALPDEHLEGDLATIAPVPLSDRSAESGNDAVYFIGHIHLDVMPPKLRPGMTAAVTIATGLRQGVLAVPATAVGVEEGRKFCYVDHADSLERRAVKVNTASRDLVEVVEGLDEGEEVVLDPALLTSASSR